MLVVIPGECDAGEKSSVPVNGAFVMFGDTINKELGVGFVGVTNKEIVHDEAKKK